MPHCNAIPKFEDDCPDKAKFCANCHAQSSKARRSSSDAKVDICCGRHLRQPEPDFCYEAKPPQGRPICSCSSGKQAHVPSSPYRTTTQPPKHQETCKTMKDGKDNKVLAKKLQECIKKFDEGSPEIVGKLETLRNFLNTKIIDEQCFPRPEWPHCPVKEGPDPYEVPHPYLPRMTMWAKPQAKTNVLKVTVDGRLGEQYQPKKFYYEEPPLNVPPWVLPRYKSQELRGGNLYGGCGCWKKNGLQDDCPRWDCGGRPECREKPLPVCPPSMNPPICGVRKPNLYLGKPPTCAKQKPPPPYPERNVQSMAAGTVPFAPSIPCPLHDNIT